MYITVNRAFKKMGQVRLNTLATVEETFYNISLFWLYFIPTYLCGLFQNISFTMYGPRNCSLQNISWSVNLHRLTEKILKHLIRVCITAPPRIMIYVQAQPTSQCPVATLLHYDNSSFFPRAHEP